MSNTAVPASAQPESSDFAESPEMENLRWEKGVEFALANELQTWHIEAGIEGVVGEAAVREKAIALARERRYVPLNGKLESALGDAFGVGSDCRLMLIECKHTLSAGEWEREALAPQSWFDGDEAKMRNKGGKNRLEQLRPLLLHKEFKLGETSCTYHSLAVDCHLLVGTYPDKNTLGVLDYWSFIFHKEPNRSFPTVMKLTDLKKHGHTKEGFLTYVAALLNRTDNVGNKDIGWVFEQMIVLAHCREKPDIGMRGFPVSRAQLREFCATKQLDHKLIKPH